MPTIPKTKTSAALVREHAFLRGYEVYDVNSSSELIAITDCTDFKPFAEAVAQSGLPKIELDKELLPLDVAALLSFPVYREGLVTSVVTLVASNSQDAIGVFEIWEPVGAFDDVKLTGGYYSKLDRFQNVSSFVRFERGVGLPGQVWNRQRAMIQCDLPNHPGFLRAAGASAESLTTAVGIPIFDDEFVASLVLISSQQSPLARGFEVWIPGDDGFILQESFYPSVEPEYLLSPNTKLAIHQGLPGLVSQRGGVCLSMDPAVFAVNRSIPKGNANIHSGIGIPHFDDATLTSILVLLF